jgi:fatty-acyl-CoA synthase
MSEIFTMPELLHARADDDGVGLRFGDEEWTYRRLVHECRRRAELLVDRRPADRPFHVGVLLDNVPEFWMMLGAATLAGATVVGINPTRRGAELARDIEHTDCAFLVSERDKLDLLAGVTLSVPSERMLVVDDEAWEGAIASYDGSALPDVAVEPSDTFMLIFTSGTTGTPKAVRMGHGRLRMWAARLAEGMGLGPHTVAYSVMPLFHSNAIVAGYASLLSVGATCVLRRRFSASQFLPDVRRYGVTFFNYVGNPLT